MKDCLLVYLSISLPTQTRTDKKVSAQVEEDNHTARGRARVVKRLFSSETFGPVQAAAQQVRMAHYKHSLAFDSTGARVLPATAVIDYENAVGAAIANFKSVADEFNAVYQDVLVTEMQRLGDLFNPSDYPSNPAAACTARIYYRTVGEVVTVDEHAREAIAENVRQSIEEGMATAMDDALARLASVVERMVHKLDDSDAIFRNSLLANVQEQAVILQTLNIFDDPRLNESISKIRLLGVTTPDQVRSDPGIRRTVADSGRSILESLKGVL